MRRREQIFEKKMFHELSFLKFSVIPNLHALFIYVILFKTVFFQHVTGRLCFSARFAQSDDVNYMDFRYTMASI